MRTPKKLNIFVLDDDERSYDGRYKTIDLNNFIAGAGVSNENNENNALLLDEEGSLYWHQGLEQCLRKCLKDLKSNILININLNIDGLPIFRSAKKCIWPILFNIYEYPLIKPMAIGVFYGEKKPSSVSLYFKPFVQEMKIIIRSGIQINGFQINVKIRSFICDSPARAFIKGELYPI